MTGESTIGRFGSGREVRRIEDAGLLAGAGRFTDDFSLPTQTYLVFLRSPHAHARIVSIDAAEALAMPGVIAVLTGDDLAKAGVKPLPVAPMFKRPDGSPGATPLRPALAQETVRFPSVANTSSMLTCSVSALARSTSTSRRRWSASTDAVHEVDQNLTRTTP